MYNRPSGHSHDPLACVDGWANSCVYVEGSWTGALEQLQKGGANVFIRNSKTEGKLYAIIYFKFNQFTMSPVYRTS